MSKIISFIVIFGFMGVSGVAVFIDEIDLGQHMIINILSIIYLHLINNKKSDES